MSKYRIRQVPTEQCSFMWRDVKPLLAPAIEASGGRWQPDYVLVALVNGHHNLWIVEAEEEIIAVATTQIIFYPERKMFCMHFLGGQGWGEWHEQLIESCSKFAKEMGCDGVECSARPGFWKWFKELGWNKSSIIYEKSI